MSQSLLSGRCDCGAVSITIPHLPENMNACPCAYCSTVGALWGYFSRGSVTIEGRTDTYQRASRILEFHRCATCGVVTHWIDPEGRVPHMGTNMRNFDAEMIAGVPVVVDY